MLLVDANIFLEVMLGQSNREACAAFLGLLRDGRRKGIVTDFTIYSIMLVLEEAAKLRELETFLSALSAYRGLTVYSISLSEKLAAVRLAIEEEFDIDDALQYIGAKTLRVEGIVSLDKHFEGREIPRIEPAAVGTSD